MKPGDRRLLPPDVRRAQLRERAERENRELDGIINRTFFPEAFGPANPATK
jgi:hypothetical protein